MLLWLAILVLTVATVFAIGWPLLRGSATEVPADAGAAGSRAVYADQLTEIETDLARGAIDAAEADAARIEVSRRLLAQAPVAAGPATPAPLAVARPVPLLARIAVLAAVPVAALALYGFVGMPMLPGQPHAAGQIRSSAKAGPTAGDVDQLVAQVEGRLREHPEDGRGWDVLGPVYTRLQRFEDAQVAFARAIELLGETPKRLIGLGEAAIKASGGMVTDEARAAFEKVLKAEPGKIEPRFWLALAREQRGDVKAAAEEYRAILAAAPADAPWRDAVGERLAAVTGGNAPPAAGGRGPTEGDIANAAGMSAEARQQMISGMVDGLHTRLKSNGRDAAGWQKLLRAYAVMGDLGKAKAALAEARQALADDTPGLGAVDALAREMGIGS